MIDVVLCWVDNNDSEWQKDYIKYARRPCDFKDSIRYRDWDNLRFLFRGLERFAPWIRKVHFVTCGHKPSWLNINCPKLHFIKHSDYIPSQFLPTFNSHTIELNYNRIDNLSEKFIYFNDDTFLINDVNEERFFKNGLPCDIASLNAITPSCENIFSILGNNVSVINKHFCKKNVLKQNITKWFNIKYFNVWYRTLVLLPWNEFTGFLDPHLPNSYLKSTFNELWEKEPQLLELTCKSKFRENSNVNQYLMRYWRICSGDFIPYNVWNDSIYIPIKNENINKISDIITNQTKSIICLNDTPNVDFVKAKNIINKSFEKILPEKSSFEL